MKLSNFHFFIFFLLAIFLFSITNISALTLTVDVPDKYSKITAGERFFFTLAVKYPENPSRIDLRLTYEIRNTQGELVAQAKVLKAIQTQASFIDSIVLPKDLRGGLHTIDILVNDYGNMDEKVGSSFTVIAKGTDRITVYFLITIGSIIFF